MATLTKEARDKKKEELHQLFVGVTVFETKSILNLFIEQLENHSIVQPKILNKSSKE